MDLNHHRHDIFISYTGPDSKHAEIIDRDLANYGAQVWFDKFSMPKDHGYDANEIRQVLISAMRESRALLILVSTRSMASRWVRFELDTAIGLEARNPRRRIVTLLVGQGSERDIPDPIRDRKVYDLRYHFDQRYKMNRIDIFRDLIEGFDLPKYNRSVGEDS